VPELRPTHEVETNILIYELPEDIEAGGMVKRLAERGVHICAFPGNAIRIVTHQDVGPEEEERLLQAIGEEIHKKE